MRSTWASRCLWRPRSCRLQDGDEVTLDLADQRLTAGEQTYTTARAARIRPGNPGGGRDRAVRQTARALPGRGVNRMPKLCVIEGDGIGREVIPAAVSVLRAVVPGLETVAAEAGWDCFLQRGVSVPQKRWRPSAPAARPCLGRSPHPARKVEGYRSAIITMRQELDLYANLRPVRSLPRFRRAQVIDLLIVRENTEGLYAGRERWKARHGHRRAGHHPPGLRAPGRAGCGTDASAGGRKRLTIVHKANILPLTDGLFRDTVRQVA